MKAASFPSGPSTRAHVKILSIVRVSLAPGAMALIAVERHGQFPWEPLSPVIPSACNERVDCSSSVYNSNWMP